MKCFLVAYALQDDRWPHTVVVYAASSAHAYAYVTEPLEPNVTMGYAREIERAPMTAAEQLTETIRALGGLREALT